MTTEMQTAVTWSGIFNDANYFGRYFRDLIRHESEPLESASALCMAPYFSLAMHESLQKAKMVDANISAAFEQDTTTVSARSRHSLKLFEDNKRGIEGQISYFRDEIFAAHSDVFLDGARPLALFARGDLSLHGYSGRLVTTSHAAMFHLGFEPRELLTQGFGSHIHAVYEEYGSYFAGLGASLEDQGGETFAAGLNASVLDKSYDVRASDYYRGVFNGPGFPELNAILTTFRAMLNFAEIVVSLSPDRQSIDYTAFKIGYISVYQVLRSVQLLLNDPAYPLTVRSVALADRIVSLESAQEILNPRARRFRNMVVHYNLPHDIDESKVDLDESLFGVVPIYFPLHNSASLMQLMKECVVVAAALFDEWAVGD
ncbi:hypothetical protein [Streptomyces jumonjinensis]|uniref:Uncharacterized protein n=1 Tax=Streptomyces jumonjinensis TaxID=1945 RepID=A0A646KE06_STRJU|nr:hypothetical protein [Streptomyces jumonjinensis]MQS99235.1 hypothetical protein [Streptomyces jumonjinensis]